MPIKKVETDRYQTKRIWTAERDHPPSSSSSSHSPIAIQTLTQDDRRLYILSERVNELEAAVEEGRHSFGELHDDGGRWWWQVTMLVVDIVMSTATIDASQNCQFLGAALCTRQQSTATKQLSESLAIIATRISMPITAIVVEAPFAGDATQHPAPPSTSWCIRTTHPLFLIGRRCGMLNGCDTQQHERVRSSRKKRRQSHSRAMNAPLTARICLNSNLIVEIIIRTIESDNQSKNGGKKVESKKLRAKMRTKG